MASTPAQIHARLTHPVIDSDGHWVEYFPLLVDYIRNVAGNKAAEGMIAGDEVVGADTKNVPGATAQRASGTAIMVAIPDEEYTRSRNRYDSEVTL